MPTGKKNILSKEQSIFQTKQTSLAKSRATSSSLHNIVTHLDNQHQQSRSMTPIANRLRRDSCASTASAGTSLCYPSSDYKENKAFELRKKSALMNKIILKNQLVNDPIFARANPIHQEIALVEQQQFMNDDTINFVLAGKTSITESNTNGKGARRRLFAKKNEKACIILDQNASSASSTTSSCTTTPLHHNSAFSAFQSTTGIIIFYYFCKHNICVRARSKCNSSLSILGVQNL